MSLISMTITDCDNPDISVSNVIYMGRLSSNSNNAPSTEYGMLFGIYIDSKQYGIQMVVTMAKSANLYVRGMMNGQWGDWVEK